jgi:ATP-dependent Lon protease
MKNKVINNDGNNDNNKCTTSSTSIISVVPDKNEKINDQNSEKDKEKKGSDDGKKEVMNEIRHLKEMIERTILSHNNYKVMDILTSNDLNMSIQYLEKIYQNLENVESNIHNKSLSETTEEIKLTEGELSSIFRNYGTQNIEDLIQVTFGSEYLKTATAGFVTANSNANGKQYEWDYDKFAILKMHFHPIHFKILAWKNEKKSATNDKLLQKNKIVEDFVIVEKSSNLDCFDMARTSKVFSSRVFGIKVALHNYSQQKTIIIGGIIDNVFLECSCFRYITNKMIELWKNVPKDPEFMNESFTKYIKYLTLKDLLVYSNDEIYSKYLSTITFINTSKQKQTSQLIKEFMNADLFYQRSMIIQLLLKSHEHDLRYLSSLLYDMLSNELSPQVESNDQVLLYNSLPWNVKQHFKDAMKQTVSYTNTISKYESGNMTLEQQICLLKTTDVIKEKAMIKLREIKSKSDDTTTKARQYLEGLLKIPFGVYYRENIMEESKKIKDVYLNMLHKNEAQELYEINEKNVLQKHKLPNSVIEIKNSCININKGVNDIGTKHIDVFVEAILNGNVERKKSDYIAIYHKLVTFIKHNKITLHENVNPQLYKNDKTIIGIKTTIQKLIKELFNMCCLKNNDANEVKSVFNKNESASYQVNMIEKLDDFLKELIVECGLSCKSPLYVMSDVQNDVNQILNTITNMTNYIENVRNILDSAIHGHTSAKRQIERIIGQWISGESSGYCFGFEGPPGVGKTSLAKYGLAKCLTNENGESRPFAFIAMGGSSNGSTLEGHNYTYVGSTWGKIVDVLMEKKCMNPIIFIDELDKISNTDHGREIVGILTHLIDSTQNDCFQDKYFSGIDLDLSKALFIFSYNNPEAVDKILLDRIHRIKFKHMTLDEKLTICQEYLLPEMYKKMGLNENVIYFSQENLKYIIERYTCEPGVRKLKELLFEIVGEMNIEHIKTKICIQELPITITNEEIKFKYLSERHEVRTQKIPLDSNVGVINGLWANVVGQGGIIPIEAHFFPCDRFFDLKLTGMQGDVMKESMNVAKTLAWSLLTETEIEINLEKFSKTKMQGIHIHCPEGATPKDGPSAGTAITCVIYSILTGKKLNNKVAITGEINLQGNVTAIGGLDLKIMGGINGGVTTFIFPKDNIKDFNDFMDKNGTKDEVKSIVFIPVSSIQEVLAIIFC